MTNLDGYLNSNTITFYKICPHCSDGYQKDGYFDGQKITDLYDDKHYRFYSHDGYSTLHLPRDRYTLNSWLRSFYYTDQNVHITIDFYAQLTKFLEIDLSNITNPSLEKFWDEQISILNLEMFFQDFFKEYWLLGECCIYLEFNEATYKFDNILIQNPDYILIKPTVKANEYIIELRPDEKLRSIVLNKQDKVCGLTKEERKIALEKLSPEIISCIKNGKNIPIGDFYSSYLARKVSPYDIRGTSFITPFLKNMLFHNDFTKFEYYPHNLENDIIARQNMQVEVNRAMNAFCLLINRKIFAAVAKANEFYKSENGEKILICPKLKWNGGECLDKLF